MKKLVTLVVDNLSPFTPDILSALDKLDTVYVCKKYFELDNISNYNYDRVILSGRRKNIRQINTVNSKLIKYCFQTNAPLLGICYGAEILALTLGGSISRMENHVLGDTEIYISKPNSLTINKQIIHVYESHRYCIAKLPEEFESLASSVYCRHEVFSHKSKKMFGTQFHPEKSGNDGFCILSTFVNL